MSSDPIQVSIIMPVKNAGKYLHDCLLSIREQTFTFWELVVVNDHSSDNTESILLQHAQKDAGIRLYRNNEQGIIPALQMALSHARGEYITRMDGDDLMPKDRLEIMHHQLQKLPPGYIVTGLVSYFSESQVSRGYLAYEQWLNDRVKQNDHWQWVYRECVIASPNWMVRKQDLTDIQGFDSLSYPEDYHLVLRWYEHGFRVKGLSRTTLQWREHPERTSRNSEHYDQQHFFSLKVRHFATCQLGSSQLVLWGTSKKGRLTAEILDQLDQPFIWMDLKDDKTAREINGHSIHHYEAIEHLKDVKLLLSVYPPEKERAELETYLYKTGLVMRMDYWYL